MTESVDKTMAARRRWLSPTEAAIGPIIVALFAAVMVALLVMGWWSVRTERTTTVAASTARVVSTGQLLADGVHTMLASDDVAAVRRMVVEAGRQAQLRSCRVLLPDGSVLADQEPSRISLDTLPKTWADGTGSSAEATQQINDGVLSLSYPIQVPGRGMVTLQLSAATGDQGMGAGQTMVVVTAVAGVTLIVLVLLYRPARSRVAPFALIREALQAVERGEADPQALKVSDGLGPEAQTWNRLIDRRGESDRRSLLRRAADTAVSGQGGAGSFDLIGDALWQGIVLVGPDMGISYANGAAAVLLKSSREDLIGADAGEFLGDDEVVSAVREVAAGSDRRRRTVEVEQVGHSQGGVLRFSVRPAGQGSAKTALVVIEDITQQRVAEEARRNFVAQVAHELRTPLTNISLNVEAAIDDGEDDPEMRGRCLNVINQETQRLGQLVNDMLSVSEIEAGSMALHHDDVRLDEFFEELKADFTRQAEEKQVHLLFDLPPKLPVIHGDRDKLAVSMHNLLGNAVKYSTPGGEVTVRVEVDNASLRVVFKDKGIGIEREELEMVFDRFYRAKDSRVSQITGTGLGLPIAREIVRRHGGDIEASSTLNQGSTFTINLPIKAEAA